MSIVKRMVEESFNDAKDKEIAEGVNKILDQIKASLSDTNKNLLHMKY